MTILQQFCSRFEPFFFNDTATTEIYTLSLHDALPISNRQTRKSRPRIERIQTTVIDCGCALPRRSEEHTSELQSPCNLVCRLLLAKKITITMTAIQRVSAKLLGARYLLNARYTKVIGY